MWEHPRGNKKDLTELVAESISCMMQRVGPHHQPVPQRRCWRRRHEFGAFWNLLQGPRVDQQIYWIVLRNQWKYPKIPQRFEADSSTLLRATFALFQPSGPKIRCKKQQIIHGNNNNIAIERTNRASKLKGNRVLLAGIWLRSMFSVR